MRSPLLRSALAATITSAAGLAMMGSDAEACPAVGITLPNGFCATIFADNIGHARQMVVAPNGTLYVNTWSGIYYKADQPPPPGGFLVALKDTTGQGKADRVERFGETVQSGGHGGTGIGYYRGGLYAEINDEIVRYELDGAEMVPAGKPTVIVKDLPIAGDHPMHPFLLSRSGDLLIDVGSATNACEEKNRTPGSTGLSPCHEKATRAGVWRYSALQPQQVFSAAQRYVSGLRNAEGFAEDDEGHILATQHGRDQLYEDWPHLYSAEEGHNLPAEEIVILKPGADYGWPECYFDPKQNKLVLAPEYGGDGGRKVGLCENREKPVAAFPAHYAPNDMKLYWGPSFPSAYKGGVFVAFHGSWNRAPGPQGGYDVVFQPLKDGHPSGPSLIFAEGFAGRFKEPGRAAYRPSGLAVAPDGSLFVSDDVHGRIWRITYHGDKSRPLEAAVTPHTEVAKASAAERPPEGVNPGAGVEDALPVPPGATREDVILGAQIFRGDQQGGTCGGCHGGDAKGSPIGADLTSGHWLWSDGSLQGIEATIANGVAHPKAHLGAMPPRGGSNLDAAGLRGVAAYVWSIGHQAAP